MELSSRTLQGRMLMRPSEVVNALILGVLGRAQAKYGVIIHAFTFLSNHFHILIWADTGDQMSNFAGFLKANLAKELGAHYDWKEKFWGARYHSLLVEPDEADLTDRFLYILANGCKEGLVGSPLDWPGVSSAQALFRGEWTMQGIWHDRSAEHRARQCGQPQDVISVETVHITPLPFLQNLPAEEQVAFARRAIHHIEDQTREQHRSQNSAPMGAKLVLERHPHERPASFVSSPAPLFYSTKPEALERMKAEREATVAAYRDAAKRLRDGHSDVRFPVGSFPPPAPFVRRRGPP